MGRFDDKMRSVERSVGKLTGNQSKGLAFRKRLETKIRQVAAQAVPNIVQRLIQAGRAGWVNDPDRNDAVLVERDTGYVPHMYLDAVGNVTVGIGLLLRDAEDAKLLPFVVRGTSERAQPRHIENAFNKVRYSKISGRTGANAFRLLTNIEISEAEAALRALDASDDFLRQLSNSSFYPEFATYPQTAKMGLLDMAYVLGPTGTRDTYKNFAAAVRRRNWKVAANESNRPQVSER